MGFQIAYLSQCHRKSLLKFFALMMFFTTSICNAQQKGEELDVYSDLGDKYFDAVEYLQKNVWMYDTLVKAEVPPDLAFGIIFPGLSRYSALRDVMETSALRTLYVQSGRKYSHYSVGRFQMKANFAELVERNVTRYKMTDHKFSLSNNAKARSERAKRLDSQEWQVEYLILYIKLMDKRFSHIKWKNPEDKVRFYSTAYNLGFNKNERTIRYNMSRKPLFNRNKNLKAKIRYGDIAAWFFVNDGHRFKSHIPIIPKPVEVSAEDE